MIKSFALQLALLPPVPFLVFLGIATGVCVRSAYLAFRALRWRRLIQDMPTSRTRSAPQGYIELSGMAKMMDGPPILSPVSRRECVWWRLVTEKRSNNEWVRVSSEQSDSLFLLQDDVGHCVVDPDGAEVTSAHRRVSTATDSMLGGRITTRTRRHTEHYIMPFDTLFVIGWHRTFESTAGWDPDAELIEKLRQWKSDQSTLLDRFDANNDGRIDDEEWALARREARKELLDEHREAQKQPGVNVIGAPDDARPFLIAAQHEDLVAWRLNWAIVGYALAAAALAILLILVGTLRLSA